MIGTALYALNYFDQTEPYATIIRLARLHDLIKGLHAPGESAIDLSRIQSAADCCIKSFLFVGKPVPPQLYQLRDFAGTIAGLVRTIDNMIPGAGAVENWLTAVFNSFGIKTSTQVLDDSLGSLKAWCQQQTGYDCSNLPQPPANAPSGWIGPAGFQNGPYFVGATTQPGQVRGPYSSFDSALLEVSGLAAASVKASILNGTDGKDSYVKIIQLPTTHPIVAGPYTSQDAANSDIPNVRNRLGSTTIGSGIIPPPRLGVEGSGAAWFIVNLS